MANLFDIWSKRIPRYNGHYEDLFERLAHKANTAKDEETIQGKGKIFASNYEFYIYAFFLGLYSNTDEGIEVENATDFSYPIENWGKKTNNPLRKDFTLLQQYIFTILITKSDIDFIKLESEEDDHKISKAVTSLINVMEKYANGGLQLISELMDNDQNYFYRNELVPLNELMKYINKNCESN